MFLPVKGSYHMKLQKLTLAALLALVTLTVHAGTDSKDMKSMTQASQPGSDAGFYVAAYGGVNFSTDYGNKRTVLSTAGGSNINVTPDAIHSDVGGVGGIKGGYNFESFGVAEGLRLQPAVEVEGLYIGMRSKDTFGTPGGASFNDTTSYNNAAGLVNGIIRFKIADGCLSHFVPYIGVGAGVEYVTSHTDLSSNTGIHPGNAGDQDIDFAAQALAGVDYNLNQHWTLFTEYKFVDALGTDLKSSSVTRGGSDYRFKPDQLAQQLATVGVKYNF
jgi:opacity protein-like surface antigen